MARSIVSLNLLSQDTLGLEFGDVLRALAEGRLENVPVVAAERWCRNLPVLASVHASRGIKRLATLLDPLL